MKLYKIRDWDSLYENNRSRTVKDLSWVSIPNRHDGENFTAIMTHKQGATIFSAFILMVQVASKCTPRGTLIKGNGQPHTVSSLSAKCRCPASWFEISIDYLSKETDWLESTDFAGSCQEPVSVLTPNPQPPDEERKKEGMERKEDPATASPTPPPPTVHAAFIDGWVQNFKAKFGFDYVFDGGRDGKAARELLRMQILPVDLLEIAKQAWTRAGQTPKAFNCEQASTLHGFKDYFNQIRTELKNGSNRPTQATPNRNESNSNAKRIGQYDGIGKVG